MAQVNLWEPVFAQLAKLGAALTDQDKAALEGFIEPLADSDANALVNAIAAHLMMNGLAGMVAPALRNALTGSEPAIDGIINSNINGGFDALEALFTKLGSSSAA